MPHTLLSSLRHVVLSTLIAVLKFLNRCIHIQMMLPNVGTLTENNITTPGASVSKLKTLNTANTVGQIVVNEFVDSALNGASLRGRVATAFGTDGVLIVGIMELDSGAGVDVRL